MTALRWWTVRAFGRSPLNRTADRVQAWAVAVALVLLAAAIIPAATVGRLGYEAHEQAVAADIAARHAVEATARTDATADATGAESPTTTFRVDVRWTDQNGGHLGVTTVDGPVKAGDRVPVWVTDQGTITTPPPSAADSRTTLLGIVSLTWLLLAGAVAGAYALLRSRLNRGRDREWDRGWRDLADNGGGSARFTP